MAIGWFIVWFYLVLASFYDWYEQEVPYKVTLSFIIIGVIHSFLTSNGLFWYGVLMFFIAFIHFNLDHFEGADVLMLTGLALFVPVAWYIPVLITFLGVFTIYSTLYYFFKKTWQMPLIPCFLATFIVFWVLH